MTEIFSVHVANPMSMYVENDMEISFEERTI